MTSDAQPSPTLQSLNTWLEQQILKLSTDALSREVLTCTACSKIKGDYIIEYQGESLRLKAPHAYAFLRYVLESP